MHCFRVIKNNNLSAILMISSIAYHDDLSLGLHRIRGMYGGMYIIYVNGEKSELTPDLGVDLQPLLYLKKYVGRVSEP